MGQRIQRPFLGASLTELLRLTGSVKLELESFVLPVITVADLSEGSTPPIIRAASSQATIAAVVGERATLRFEVPPSVICRVDRLWVLHTTGMNVVASFETPGAAQATPALRDFTDQRLLFGQAQEPAAFFTHGTQVAGITPTAWTARATADGTEYFPNNWIIGSGNADDFAFMEIQGVSANQAMTLSISWTEFQIV